MNHLAHLRLALGVPHLLAGALLGDQVKGRLEGRFDADLEQGIRLHRAIDAFTDAHPVARRTYRRLPSRFRRFGPILVDVFYDHCLAVRWGEYHDQPLEDFTRTTFAALREPGNSLPARVAEMADRMERSGILLRYRDPSAIAGVLGNIARRLRRSNPVAEAFEPFLAERTNIEADFREFFPQIEGFVRERVHAPAERGGSHRKTGGIG